MLLKTKSDAELLRINREIDDILLEQARKGRILPYTKLTFEEYEINWHHKLMAKYLDKFIKKEIRRLMIFLPPRVGKSELTSRRLPSLWHGIYPNDEIMMATYNGDLAGDMTVDIQRIMDRPSYQRIFPEVKITAEGKKTSYARSKNEHEIIPYQDPNDKLWKWHTGSFKSSGVGGSFTGRGANLILIDDPIKNREDADSFTTRENIWKFYASTLRTRLEGVGSILITMTRWHDDDLAGRLLKLAASDPHADQWVVVNLPAIKEDDSNPEDTREIGQSIWENKFSTSNMLTLKASIGSREWSALYQQKPVSDGGNVIKKDWLKYYQSPPAKFEQMIQSWDFAVKDKSGADFTVGQVWGRNGADKYLLGQIRGRFNFPDACQKLLELSRRYPGAHKKLIESKANGPAVVQTLRKTVSGLVEVEPRGDKLARLHAVSTEFESGNVYLPDPELNPWVKDYIHELLAFPTATNDDQVDATTQALDELRKASSLYLPLSGHGSGVIFT